MIGRFIISTAVSLTVAYMAGAVEARIAAAGNSADAADREPRPYDKKAKAWTQVDAAFARARRSGKRVMLVMGSRMSRQPQPGG